MKYAVDRIEENIVILENLKNKETIKVEKSFLPSNIRDGSVVKVQNNKYVLEENNRRKIRKRFNKLKKQ